MAGRKSSIGIHNLVFAITYWLCQHVSVIGNLRKKGPMVKSPLLMLIGVVIATLIVWQLPASTMNLGICQGLAIALLVVMAKLLQKFIETNRLRLQMAIMQSEVSQLHRQVADLKAEAWHDKLTGLGNRNFLEDRFSLAKERSTRNNSVFALIMIDLNDFKSINDHFGHAAGDEVLIAVARRLSASVRGTDSVIRLGGDEFVVLVEEAERTEGLFHLGQKLMDTFFDDIELSNHQLVHVGASMGMARFPVDGVEIVQLLDLADQGMYESKASQRMPIELS